MRYRISYSRIQNLNSQTINPNSIKPENHQTPIPDSHIHHPQKKKILRKIQINKPTFRDLRDLSGRRIEQEPFPDGDLLIVRELLILVLLADSILHPKEWIPDSRNSLPVLQSTPRDAKPKPRTH